jgi:hypothetical protein
MLQNVNYMDCRWKPFHDPVARKPTFFRGGMNCETLIFIGCLFFRKPPWLAWVKPRVA